MYLIEYKLGDGVIKTFIGTPEILQEFIENNPQYEYIKILKEVDTINISNSKPKNKTLKKKAK